jgi:hypothetical protein
MKTVITNYTFNVSAKTITFTDFNTAGTAIDLKRLYLITDVTKNTILYNFADYTVSSATATGAVIALSTLPSGLSNSDNLNIVYEALPTDPVPLVTLTSRLDSTSTANVIYVGEAAVGSSEGAAVWRIAAVTITGGIMSYKYANSAYFTSIWSNRTSLTYS